MPSGQETRVINALTGGQKGRKPERFGLLPKDQLAKVARLYAAGAEKYDDNNWRKGYDWSLSIDALHRHMAAFEGGEQYDSETGEEHLASVCFHALALMFFEEAHPELDDRYILAENVARTEPLPGGFKLEHTQGKGWVPSVEYTTTYITHSAAEHDARIAEGRSIVGLKYRVVPA